MSFIFGAISEQTCRNADKKSMINLRSVPIFMVARPITDWHSIIVNSVDVQPQLCVFWLFNAAIAETLRKQCRYFLTWVVCWLIGKHILSSYQSAHTQMWCSSLTSYEPLCPSYSNRYCSLISALNVSVLLFNGPLLFLSLLIRASNGVRLVYCSRM